MNKYIKNALIILGVILVIFILGYYTGRRTFTPQTVTEVKWMKGQTIRDSIDKPIPYKVEVPSDPKYIYVDRVVPGEPPLVDTMAILADCILKRQYAVVLIDNDTVGYFKLYADVQYNKLQNTRYEFTPVIKTTNTVTTVERPAPLFTPFIMTGFNTKNMGSIGGGVFVKDIGVAYEYIHRFGDEKFDAHALKIIYKF